MILRPFHRPRLWLGLWLAGWALCIGLSLVSAPSLPMPAGNDKIGHFLAYFTLSAWAMQIFAAQRAQLLAAGALFLLGLGMEFGQWALTKSRVAESADLLANTVGIGLGLALATNAWSSGVLLRIDRRLFGRAKPP